MRRVIFLIAFSIRTRSPEMYSLLRRRSLSSTVPFRNCTSSCARSSSLSSSFPSTGLRTNLYSRFKTHSCKTLDNMADTVARPSFFAPAILRPRLRLSPLSFPLPTPRHAYSISVPLSITKDKPRETGGGCVGAGTRWSWRARDTN